MFDFSHELENLDFLKADVGNSKNGTVEKGYFVYHVIQQAENRMNLFNSAAAKHRDGLFKAECQRYGIIPLANVIMPNHIHDLVATNDVEELFVVMKNVNQGISRFIRGLRRTNDQSVPPKVFNSRPGYKPVKSREQLMILIKYLYDNPAYLKQRKEFVPYSCFDFWEQNYTKPYRVDILETILEIKIDRILELCRIKNNKDFNSLAHEMFGKDSSKYNDSVFKVKKAEKANKTN